MPTEPPDSHSYHCGYVAIVGRPNVGKSTLMNRLVGQKISITAHKPQTTRHRIIGIKTTAAAQLIFVDTPGLHQGVGKAMNKYMNRAANSTITDVDVVLFLVDGLKWTDEDEYVLRQVKASQHPVILVINKADHIHDKTQLLPYLQQMAQKMDFADIIPVSALKGDAVETLEQQIIVHLPESEPFFPEDQLTDRSERFLAAELVREKLMRSMGQELPYATTVEIEKFEVANGVRRIAAVIWVEREGQKAIIIGKQGQLLKRLGMQARKDMEQLFDGKVFLQLWVKVKQGWSDDERALRSLGYTDGYTENE